MHIAVFLQHYHTPDCPTAARPYALVERLGQDHAVTVITTRAWEDTRTAHRFPWAPPGVDLVRFDVPYNNSMTSTQRLTSFLIYAARAVRHGLQMPRPDLFLGSSTPLTAAAAAGLVARIRDVPWVFEVQDLWPAFPIQMGAVPNVGLPTLLRWGEAALYRSAAEVVTVSPDMEQHVRVQAPSASVTTLPYGADPAVLDTVDENRVLTEPLSRDRRFLVLYAGTFGRANAIPTLLDAARRLVDGRSDVLVALAGRGHHAPLVEQAACRHDAIRRLSPRPYPDTLALFEHADLSLIPFRDRPVLAANAPSKFFDSLATGTPVVVTNPGWTRRFVERHGCGWSVPPESPGTLADRVRAVLASPKARRQAGQNARAAARRCFNRDAMLNRYTSLIETAAGLASNRG
ncbi:glycosyltransferase family 4 protein [Salinibacter altiplanensis]|uniref:glycosyltransferase family 4 protein n=1 Tax=Salinibacter altiplanensis TaxID=1803181 RepID=UPI000C9FB4AD|nr:glycosyltransferase family 4 protein [Salinibacter altiplanensis]